MWTCSCNASIHKLQLAYFRKVCPDLFGIIFKNEFLFWVFILIFSFLFSNFVLFCFERAGFSSIRKTRLKKLKKSWNAFWCFWKREVFWVLSSNKFLEMVSEMGCQKDFVSVFIYSASEKRKQDLENDTKQYRKHTVSNKQFYTYLVKAFSRKIIKFRIKDSCPASWECYWI